MSRIFSPVVRAPAGRSVSRSDFGPGKLVREALIDNHHRGRVEPIRFVEGAALQERDPHGLEVIRRRSGTALPAVVLPASDVLRCRYEVPLLLPLKGIGTMALADSTPGSARIAIRIDRRMRLHFPASGRRLRQSNTRREKALGPQARLHPTEPGETLDQQPGADQQDQGKRHLNHDTVAEACFSLSAAAGPRPGLERLVQIDLRRLPGRDEPKRAPVPTETKSVKARTAVSSWIVRSGVCFTEPLDERLRPPLGKQQTSRRESREGGSRSRVGE